MKSNVRVSKKRERNGAKEIDGKSHLRSGALWFNRGDFSNGELLIEDKFTYDMKYTIAYSVLSLVDRQAKKVLKLPVLKFGFETVSHNYAVINKNNFIVPSDFEFNMIDKIITNKSSITFQDTILFVKYISSNKKIPYIELEFTKHNSSFYILMWKDFLDNLSLLLNGEPNGEV